MKSLINAMCRDCKLYQNGCAGEKNLTYTGCVYKESKPTIQETVNTLMILDKLDSLRRRNSNLDDHTLRVACAVIAKEAGCPSRNDWTNILAVDTSSEYHQYLNAPIE